MPDAFPIEMGPIEFNCHFLFTFSSFSPFLAMHLSFLVIRTAFLLSLFGAEICPETNVHAIGLRQKRQTRTDKLFAAYEGPSVELRSNQEQGGRGILRKDQFRFQRAETDENGEKRHTSGLVVNLRNPHGKLPRKQGPRQMVRFNDENNQYISIPARKNVRFDENPPMVHNLPPPSQVRFRSVPTIHEIPRRPHVSFAHGAPEMIPGSSGRSQVQSRNLNLMGHIRGFGGLIRHRMDRALQQLHRRMGNPAWPRQYAERNRRRNGRGGGGNKKKK